LIVHRIALTPHASHGQGRSGTPMWVVWFTRSQSGRTKGGAGHAAACQPGGSPLPRPTKPAGFTATTSRAPPPAGWLAATRQQSEWFMRFHEAVG